MAPGLRSRSRARRADAGAAPLTPQRKWRAITLATLTLLPGYWAMIVGVVTLVSDEGGIRNPEAAVAFGVAIIPFVFIVLAFASEHPRAPGAVVRAMGLSLLVGIPVSAVAADAVTGLVAGLSAGGAVALRSEPDHTWRPRALGVVVATAYTFVLIRTVGPFTLVAAPIFPFTALGLADHLADHLAERQGRGPGDGDDDRP